jgi:segregation and condensation protein B
MSPDANLPATAGLQEPGGAPDRVRLEAGLEALLFSSEVPLTAERLAQLTGARRSEVVAAIDRLNVFYGESSRAFRIATLAGGFQLVTLPEQAELLATLHKDGIPTRLSRAALETLSIVAFKQPVTRAEVDAIRGVSASDGVLRHLLERKLVRISGRAEAPGRPLLYVTTREFLSYFGLATLADLPRTEELEALLAGTAAVDEDEAEEDETLMAGAMADEAEDAERERASDEETLVTADVPSHSGKESDEGDGPPQA